MPRESAVQHSLDLGATEEMRQRVIAQRVNVDDYVYDDMTRSALPDNAFDVVVAVEVLEHVEEDERFIQNVARVLKPGGSFVMTTPNGDFLRHLYPDHKRHYEREQLRDLLAGSFAEVDTRYTVNDGPAHPAGGAADVDSHSAAIADQPGPLFLSDRLEAIGGGGAGPVGKRHLVAVAHKRAIGSRVN